MEYPHIDKRTKKDLLNYIKDSAQYYSPEWRFNEDDMDMGSVLSVIFVNMFKDTIDRFNEVPYKNFVTFLNIINAELLPSFSSEGYITFNLVKGINEGVLVKQGEKLSGKAEDSESIVFETEKNIYVTPATINYIYNCSYNNDSIIKIYDYENEIEGPVKLFSKEGKNLQNHEMTIKHSEVLNLTQNGQIEIFFQIKDEMRKEALDILSTRTSWSYFDGEEHVLLNNITINNNSLLIEKEFSKDFNDLEKRNLNNLGILKCKFENLNDLHILSSGSITLRSRGMNLLPDIIFCRDLEVEDKVFFAFSEKISVYNDFSIACREAFSKKKAHITITFNMKFVKIPIQAYSINEDIDWKYIMKKSSFKKPEEYEISVAEIIWEYWNGKGWAKLKTAMDYSEIFNFEEDFQKRRIKLQFICPEDIEYARVHSYDGLFIRARILRVNNEFRIHGFYIVPYIEEVRINYEYLSEMFPEEVKVSNNMIDRTYNKNNMENAAEAIKIFEKLKMKNNISYFAFDKKPEGAPIRILFLMDTILPEDRPILIWEYWNGTQWKSLSLVDDTENMRKSGIVSFFGEEDFEKKILFNKNMYWIRIYNLKGQYEEDKIIAPAIKSFFMNTVEIVQKDSKGEELFFIDKYEKSKTIKLIHKNASRDEVWVNEFGDVSSEEILKTPRKNRKVIRNELGEVKEVWIRWEEVDDFTILNENYRGYIIDRNMGEITFGDGINGKIPTSNNSETIKVIYSVGGGEKGNVEAGQIKNMERSIGYINKAFNPMPTGGGCDIESMDEAIKRVPLKLKNRNRAVTSEDYENLAREGSRNISKVKCFSGLNPEGDRETGAVTLVIFPKRSFENNVYFDQLRNQIKLYFQERNLNLLNKKGKFNIIMPCFVRISVKVEAEAEDMDSIFSVKEKIEEKLIKFIDPIKGNFDEKGWEIGEFPVREKISNSLKYINGLKRISKIIIAASIDNKGRNEDIDIEKFKKSIYGIPISGEHKVKLYASDSLLF